MTPLDILRTIDLYISEVLSDNDDDLKKTKDPYDTVFFAGRSHGLLTVRSKLLQLNNIYSNELLKEMDSLKAKGREELAENDGIDGEQGN